MDTTEITAGRLHLRPWRPGDAPAVAAAFGDRDTARWTSAPQPYTDVHARTWVGEQAPAGWERGDDLTFAVCDSTTGEVLGSVALRTAGRPGTWDVGYWTAPQARGQGVALGAVNAVCGWAFGALGAARVQWQAAVGNVASRRVAEKAGFTVEGILRGALDLRGERRDAWVGARLPSDEVRDTARFPAFPDSTDGVVRLRRWRGDEHDVVRRACDDPGTARSLPVPSRCTESDAVTWLRETVPGEWVEGTRACVAVEDAETAEVLGSVALQVRGDVGEIGSWTAPWARGRPVAGRAAALVARWGFEAAGLVRVELLAAVDDPASQRAAERAGFVREGVRRGARPVVRPGPADPAARHDLVAFALLPRDLG